MTKLVNATAAVILALLAVSAMAGAFTQTEKATIAALKSRITTLEQSTVQQGAAIRQLTDALSAVDIRVDALEAAVPAFTFTNVVALPGPQSGCTPTNCYADIEWNVEPCATGQVEYGETTAYGNMTTKETSLLCFHKQRINGLKPSTAYHFRIWATDGTEGGAVGTLTFSS